MTRNQHAMLLALGLILPLSLSAALLVQSGRAALAQTSVPVFIEPSTVNLSPGGMATVDVMVGDGVDNLYGAQFRLTSDPSEVEIIDANAAVAGVQITPGPLLAADLTETSGQDFLIAQNLADPTGGVVTFTIVQLYPAKPVAQGGILASLTLKGVAPGESSIALSQVLLSDAEGQAIPSVSSEGRVTVASPAAPPPAASPDPSVASTPTPAPLLPVAAPPSEDIPGRLAIGIIIGVVAVLTAIIIAVTVARRRGGSSPA